MFKVFRVEPLYEAKTITILTSKELQLGSCGLTEDIPKSLLLALPYH
jgi:hypothetical protein